MQHDSKTVIVEFGYVQRDGQYWVYVDTSHLDLPHLGPFETIPEAQQVIDMLRDKAYAGGAVDLPLGPSH